MSQTKHALLSASGSHRWMLCPASVALTKDLPEESSEYAQEGTKAHAMAEALINSTLEGEPKKTEALMTAYSKEDKEMYRFVLEYIKSLKRLGKPTLETPLDAYDVVETEVTLPMEMITGEEGGVGTADCLILDGTTLHVCDLKYGQGVPVDAYKNTQLLMYATAAKLYMEQLYPVDKVMAHIMQPRVKRYQMWDIRAGGNALLVKLKKSAKRALEIVADPSCATPEDYHPSEETCRFCKGKLQCEALRKSVEQDVLSNFEVLDVERVKENRDAVLPVPTDPRGLGKAYALLPALRLWADAVEAEAFRQANEGTTIPGFKLVAGRAGPRKWKDEDAVKKLLKEYAAEPDGSIPEEYLDIKVLSPAKMEKYCDDKYLLLELEGHITRSDGKPQLVPEDDARPALTSPADEFEVLT